MSMLARMLPALLLTCTLAGSAAAVEWRDWNAGLSAAAASSRPVLVDVYTDWCGWCRRMDRDVYGRADVARYLSQKFVTIRLNAESSESVTYRGRSMTARSLASSFDVSGYPTTLFLTSDGEHLVNVPGYVEAGRFLLLLRYVGDGHMERGVRWDEFVKRSAAQGAAR